MSRFDGLPLLDLIPALSPDLRPPYHLREWCELIERAATEPVRGLCACPIRHFKTTTTLHGIVWLLLKDPSRSVILLTHSHQRAQTLGKQLRQLAQETPIGPAPQRQARPQRVDESPGRYSSAQLKYRRWCDDEPPKLPPISTPASTPMPKARPIHGTGLRPTTSRTVT